MIFNKPALDLQSFPKILQVGAKPTQADIAAVTQLATVLSNSRWSSTVLWGAGGSFDTGTIGLFVPMGSTGRCNLQVIVQSPNAVSLTGLRVMSMRGDRTYSTLTSTSTYVANPTDLRGTTGTWWASPIIRPNSVDAQIFTYGLSKIELYGVKGSCPLAVTVTATPSSGNINSSQGNRGRRYFGKNTPAWPNNDIVPLSAAWARAMRDALEVGEAMPVIVGMEPEMSGYSLTYGGTFTTMRAMSKRIPLARPRRPKCIYFAFRRNSTGSPTFKFQVGAQSIPSSRFNNAYSYSASGQAAYVKYARLTEEAYTPSGEANGVPLVDVKMVSLSANVAGATVWIGEDYGGAENI